MEKKVSSKVYLLTKNSGKLLAAESAFSKYNIAVGHLPKSYPEIQAETSLEIARAAAEKAAEEYKLPVIREDHSIVIHALGIPGPYISFVEKKLPPNKLLKILSLFKDRSGYFEIATVFARPGVQTEEFVYRVPITFATEERGTLSDGWTKLIILDGENRTLAEYDESERLHIWCKNFDAIAGKIKK